MVEPLSLPAFRRKVDSIPEPTVRYAVKLLYETAGRANELCGRGTEEFNTTYQVVDGQKVGKRVASTRPLCPTRERVSLDEYQDDAHGKVEVLTLTLRVLKRRQEVIKNVALPMADEYDPWVRQLAGIVEKLDMGEPLLPYNRRTVSDWLLAYGLTGYDLGIREGARVLNPLRHLRLTHLVTYYDFNEFDLLQVGGWAPRTALIAGPMGDYLRLAWRKYFPKLLVPLPRQLGPLPSPQA